MSDRAPASPRAAAAIVVAVSGLLAAAMAEAWRGLGERGPPSGGDLPFHLADCAALADAVRALDPHLWLSHVSLGYPAGLTYPVLPQLIVAALHVVGVDLGVAFTAIVTLCACGAPVTWFCGLRLAGLSPWSAALAAVAVGSVTSTSPWGLGAAGLLYAGLLPQSVALVVAPLALGASVQFVRTGARAPRAVLLVLLAGACHPTAIAALAAPLVVVAVACGREAVGRLARLVTLAALAALPLLVPALVDVATAYGGVEGRAIGDAGEPALLSLFARGLLLDMGRPPTLTVFAGLAVASAARSSSPAAQRAAAIVAVLGVLVGVVIAQLDAALLPLGRLVVVPQAACAVAAGLFVAGLAERAAARGAAGRALGVGAATLFGATLAATAAAHVASLARRPPVVSSSTLAAERTTLSGLAAQSPPPRLAAASLEAAAALELSQPFLDDRVPALFVGGGPSFHGAPARRVLQAYEPSLARRLHVGAVLDRDERGAVQITLTDPGTLCEGAAPPIAHTTSDDDGWPAEARASLARPGTLVRGVAAGALAGAVAVQRVTQTPSRLDVDVDVDRGVALLVCKVGAHPWWRAEVDGADRDVVTVAPQVVGVAVRHGERGVVLRFVRPWWTWALWLCAPLAVVLARRLSRGPSSPPP